MKGIGKLSRKRLIIIGSVAVALGIAAFMGGIGWGDGFTNPTVAEPRVADGESLYQGIMTAYRQRSLAIGRFLQEAGPTKASRVAQTLREPKARDILYRDVYGWFERESLGVYGLSPRGKQEIPH